MAKKKEKEVKIKRELITIRLDKIKLDPGQPRKKFDQTKIKELSSSIKEEGLQQPILVKPDKDYNKTGKVVLVAGERRLRAVKLLKWKKIEAIIVFGKADTFAMSLVENMARQDLNPIEEAEALQKLITEKKYGLIQTANLIGRSQTYVQQRLTLLTLPKEIQQMIIDDKLPQTTALNLAQYQTDKGELIRIAIDIVNQKLSAKEAKAKILALKREKRMNQANVAEVPEEYKLRLEAGKAMAPLCRRLSRYLDALMDLTKEELLDYFKGLTYDDRQSLFTNMERVNDDIGAVFEILKAAAEED